MNITLIVLRTSDTKRLADFYSALGLDFEYHKHSSSPMHYSTKIGETILEIYPLAKGQTEADKNFRLGLGIDNFDHTIESLKMQNVQFAMEPQETDFGFMAIILDTDERKIELYRNS